MTNAITPASYLGALHGRASYELCAIHGRDVIRMGIFDDSRKAEQAACEHDGKARGLYVTVNPTTHQAGNPNHLRQGRRVSSNDIRRRVHWYQDFDSERPNKATTNATEREHAAALKQRDAAATWIVKQGGPDPKIMGDSGNGAWSLYELDNNATDIQRAHKAIAEKFSNAFVSLDERVTDLPRLHPLAGTIKAKGPHSEQRPHRRTSAEININAGTISAEFLAYLAGMLSDTAIERPRADLIDYNGQQLPKAAIDFITTPPKEGQRNAQLFTAARAMRDAGLSEQQARDTLTPIAIAVGFTPRKAAGVIQSTFAYQSAGNQQIDVSVHLATWRAAVISLNNQKQTRAGLQKTRVALALADIAERVKKIEIGAGVRDVSIGAALTKNQTAKALNSLRRDDGLIYCTNLRRREVGDARTYKLTIPKDVVTEGTLIELGGKGADALCSMSVPLVTTWMQHEFVSTKTGSVVAQIMQATLAGPLTMSQLRKTTGRKPETLTKALEVMRSARLIKSEDVIQRGNATEAWRLTTTDMTRISATFDKLAIRFKAVGRREYLRREYAKERELFHRVDFDGSMADQIRESQRRQRKSSGIRAAAANMNARAQGKAHLDRVEINKP